MDNIEFSNGFKIQINTPPKTTSERASTLSNFYNDLPEAIKNHGGSIITSNRNAFILGRGCFGRTMILPSIAIKSLFQNNRHKQKIKLTRLKRYRNS